MASTKEYLDFVLDQLSDLEELSYRAMMGEYVLYFQKKVIGGIYDDRLLLKPTRSAQRLLRESGRELQWELPYPGAKELLAADVDDRELSCRMIRAIAEELPAPKPKRRSGK